MELLGSAGIGDAKFITLLRRAGGRWRAIVLVFPLSPCNSITSSRVSFTATM
jgi:hypothetical protein